MQLHVQREKGSRILWEWFGHHVYEGGMGEGGSMQFNEVLWEWLSRHGASEFNR